MKLTLLLVVFVAVATQALADSDKETDATTSETAGTCGGYPCPLGTVKCKKILVSLGGLALLKEKIICLGLEKRELQTFISTKLNPMKGQAVFVLQYSGLNEDFEDEAFEN